LPGTVGAPETLIEESFEAGLLEYPHYTRPQVWRERAVPDVLLSGNHGKIKAWRQAAAEAATKGRRPDLWDRYQTRKTAGQKDNETERATGRLAGALKEEVEK
jgi:tRNA (guanine37-N1)-methyltransferase